MSSVIQNPLLNAALTGIPCAIAKAGGLEQSQCVMSNRNGLGAHLFTHLVQRAFSVMRDVGYSDPIQHSPLLTESMLLNLYRRLCRQELQAATEEVVRLSRLSQRALAVRGLPDSFDIVIPLDEASAAVASHLADQASERGQSQFAFRLPVVMRGRIREMRNMPAWIRLRVKRSDVLLCHDTLDLLPPGELAVINHDFRGEVAVSVANLHYRDAYHWRRSQSFRAAMDHHQLLQFERYGSATQLPALETGEPALVRWAKQLTGLSHVSDYKKFQQKLGQSGSLSVPVAKRRGTAVEKPAAPSAWFVQR